MKTRITAVLLGFITSISFGQLNFVKEIPFSNINPSSVYVIDESNLIEDSKYLIGQEPNKRYTYHILKPDYSIYKTVIIDTSGLGNSWIGGVSFSDHLVNSDDNVEIMYEVAFQEQAGWTEQKIKMVIADENGNIIQQIDSVGWGSNPFYNGDKTNILLRTNQSTNKVYEFGGNLPCPSNCNNSSSSTNKSQPIVVKPDYSFQIFPNPVNENLSIETDLDESNMQMKIYTTSGKLLKTDSFFSGSNQVDISSLASGTYVINVISGNKFLHTEQFVKK